MQCSTISTDDLAETQWEEVLRAGVARVARLGGPDTQTRRESASGSASISALFPDGFLAVRLTMSRVASVMGAAENVPHENPLKTIEKRRLSRAARIYDAARVVSFSGRPK